MSGCVVLCFVLACLKSCVICCIANKEFAQDAHKLGKKLKGPPP